MKKASKSFYGFVCKNHTVFMMVFLLICSVSFGSSLFDGAGATVQSTINSIGTLVGIVFIGLGGLIIVIGGAMYGIGWLNDNPENHAKSIKVIAGGAIILAIGAGAAKFVASGGK